jgi:chemotaxis protein methyltransferase CheR
MAITKEHAGLAAGEISPENYAFIQRYIYAESGIVVDSGKHYLLESRLVPIVRQEKLGNLNDLCHLLRATGGGELKRQVVESLTTNETLFFRDPPVFDALREHVLPQLMALRKDSRQLSIWSAASSTGQEAYSLAMLLSELGGLNWTIRILGTDLNEQILARAAAGRFAQLEVNRGLPARLLVKYFRRAGLDWEIDPAIRAMVRFERFDLRNPMGRLGAFDLVLCRNVLIYFDVETKKKILREIRGILRPGGLLLLGSAETTINLDENYTRAVYGSATFYKPQGGML